jgi:GxxExxY protein
METTLKYGDVTEAIIGCAMKVHQKMKNGFVENVYQRCLAIEFEKKGLSFAQEREVNIFYEEIWVGKRRVDFLVEEKIVVEIKALTELTDVHLAQGLNYLEAHNLEVGLLINFGSKSLQFKRLINQHKVREQKNPANPVNPINPRS